MDPERKSFIDAIAADPDCDTTRLVYADWLQERGENERAELIRVMIAYYKTNVRTLPQGKQHFDYCMWFWDRFYSGSDQNQAGGELERGMLNLVNPDWQWWIENGDRLKETEWVPLVRFYEEPPSRTSTKQEFVTILGQKCQEITMKRVAAGRKAECKYLISEKELNLSRSPNGLYEYAIRFLEEKLAIEKCCELWWPGTKFEYPKRV